LGDAARHIPVSLVEQWVVLHYQEGWWFSSRMVLSWTEVKALLTFSSMELRSKLAEDARADADALNLPAGGLSGGPS
jgi:hypothetical protein